MIKKSILICLVILYLYFNQSSFVIAEQVSPPGMGFGVCHWPGTYGMARSDSTINWFYWGGGAEDWINIEPQREIYNFAPLDKQYDDHFKRKPNTYTWLDIMTGMPSTVPDWAKQDSSLGYIELSSSGRASTFPIWNKEYQKVFEALLTKTSEHIYSSAFKYRNNIKAVIMMSGGSFGEMITWGDCPNGDLCKKYLAAGYTDEVYYDALVNWLTPLYIRLFPDYPIVLQLGGGIYGNGIGGRVANALADKYGSRMFIKWNSWNRKYAQEPTNTDKAYYNVLKSVAGKARVGLEPGYAWAIPDSTSDEMRQSIYNSLMKTLEEVPVSYFCLQDKYYKILTDIQIKELSLRMRGLHSVYPTFPPLQAVTPTMSPTLTVTPIPTTLPANPDVNNDGKITMIDYYYVVFAQMGGIIPSRMSADINKDNQINDLDLSLIRTVIKK